MPSFLEARELVLSRATRLPAEEVPIHGALGRVLGADITSPEDFPPFDNSAMDGWALRAADAPGPVSLPLAGFVPAGAPADAPLAPGTAVRIMTGALIPAGADSVVPLEDAEERDGKVHLTRPVRRGTHVRVRGRDLTAGELALRAGTVVGPADVSFLASAGRLTVPLVRRPRVAIVSTGDELVAAGQPLGPGQIRDSNGPSVAAAVIEAGGIPFRLAIGRDDAAQLRPLLEDGLRYDVLVTTAGVSMGDRDFVRPVLEALGVESVFFTLEAKPGHPTAFGVRGTTLVFSLPGNPVSTLMMFDQLVRPVLRRMEGHAHVLRRLFPAVLDEPLPHRPGRVTFSRVKLELREGVLHARSAGNQETGALRGFLEADGVALLPPERADAPAGITVPVQVYRPGFEPTAT